METSRNIVTRHEILNDRLLVTISAKAEEYLKYKNVHLPESPSFTTFPDEYIIKNNGNIAGLSYTIYPNSYEIALRSLFEFCRSNNITPTKKFLKFCYLKKLIEDSDYIYNSGDCYENVYDEYLKKFFSDLLILVKSIKKIEKLLNKELLKKLFVEHLGFTLDEEEFILKESRNRVKSMILERYVNVISSTIPNEEDYYGIAFDPELENDDDIFNFRNDIREHYNSHFQNIDVMEHQNNFIYLIKDKKFALTLKLTYSNLTILTKDQLL